ncbi:MAG: amidohydrolase family protein [Planctomycetes bacterium]|nr:amidohydrolase family protein [Planctomycetota bacterium]
MIRALTLVLALAPTALAQTFGVHAAKIHGPEGVVEDATLLIEDGKIRALVRGRDVPSGTPIVEHEGALTAGLVAAHSYAGLLAESHDDTRSVLPEARVAHAFDAGASDFRRALAAGVTTLVLAPQPATLVPGVTAVAKSAGGTIVRREAHLAIGLDARAQRINRAPTSPAGMIAELEARFAKPEGAFASVAAGRLPVMIAAQQRDDIERALAFATKHRLTGALLHSALAGELLADVQRSGFSVVFAPLGIGVEQRAIESVVKIAKAGVPFAFALDLPYDAPDALRVSAALAVRGGVEPAVALRALTSDAARIAGVQDRVGTLAKGMDADFVLWSGGDPLDLGSRPVAVYVDGVERLGGAR